MYSTERYIDFIPIIPDTCNMCNKEVDFNENMLLYSEISEAIEFGTGWHM